VGVSGRYSERMDDRRTDDRLDHDRLDEWMRWQPSRGGRFAWLLLTPARTVVGIGSLMAVIAGFMPWAAGRAPAHSGFEEVFFSGLAGQGDGVVLILVSAGAGLLTIHRTPATSRVRMIRLLPAIFVVLAALTWVNGLRASLLEIAAWERRGGTGAIAPGLWLAAAGIVLMAAGTVVLLPDVVRWRRRPDDPEDLGRPGLREVAELAGGGIGVFVGAALGIELAISLTGPTLVGTIALGAVFGGMAGAYGGAWLGRSLVDRLRGKPADTMGRHGPRP
jgi:hypothetical protein